MTNSDASSDGISQMRLVGPEFIPDPGKETVEVPIEVDKGEVKFKIGSGDEDSGPLADLLENGTIGTLTVLASALKNEKYYDRLAGELLEIILPSTVLVWFKIKTDHREKSKIPEYAEAYLGRYDLPPAGRKYRLIPVALREHLWLRHRGMKDPEVQSCQCSVPELLQSKGEEDLPREFSSLHQAYMGLSEIFEKQRDTHGGNVYTKGYFWDPNKRDWRPLDFFRYRRPHQCIWMAEDWDWLKPLWVKPEGSSTAVEGRVEEREWDAWSPALGSPNAEDKRSLKQVVRMLRREGYAPYDPLRDDPPSGVSLEGQNWERHHQHWDLG